MLVYKLILNEVLFCLTERENNIKYHKAVKEVPSTSRICGVLVQLWI